MRIPIRATAAAAVAAAAVVAAATPAFATTSSPVSAGVVFVQTDNTAGNRVVAYDRAADGTLIAAGSYATGGRGGILAGSVVDHTASQGSLASDPRHGLLYAVNAGSDTISVFAVRGAPVTSATLPDRFMTGALLVVRYPMDRAIVRHFPPYGSPKKRSMLDMRNNLSIPLDT